MPAILAWFTTQFLAAVATELFKKAMIFLAFNIILQFIISYITSHGADGVTVFGVGGSVSSAIAGIATPQVAYVLDCFYVVQGLFLILNAYLARFAYRLTIAAVAGAR